MKFYGHIGNNKFGLEKCGTEGRGIKNFKTNQGAINYFKKWFNDKPFTLYSFTNFYKNSTFKLIYEKN